MSTNYKKITYIITKNITKNLSSENFSSQNISDEESGVSVFGELTTKEKLYVYLRYCDSECDPVSSYIIASKKLSNEQVECILKRDGFNWSSFINYEDAKKEFGFFKKEVKERYKEMKELGEV